MAHWVHRARARHPTRAAVEGPERTLTYTQLSEAAIGAAGALHRMGLEPGARVALALAPGEEFLIALHGCLLSGHPAVPVDLRLTAAEQARSRAGAAALIDAPLLAQATGTPQMMAAAGEIDVAVMHTSGTTSAPKPVALSYENFQASALGSAVALGFDPAERWLCPMPLTHVGGLSIPIRSAIYATTVVLHGRFEPEAVLRELMDPARRITLVSLVPTMLARLLDAGLQRPPTLRWALLGGGPIAPALLARAHEAGVPVAPSYGMTEACSQIATFGWPLTGVDVMISAGEVIVKGPIVATGSADEEGWLRTGDLGRFGEHGLEIIGRKSETIITGGENVAPAEIEAVLLEHPDVADAAVHPRSDPEWGEAVIATVVLRAGALTRPDELHEFCAGRLARFKVPKAFEFALELPRTPSGKLLRRELT